METLQQTPMEDDSEPPLTETFMSLLQNSMANPMEDSSVIDGIVSPERDLPLIDISRLWSEGEREGCVKEMAMAAKEWGFFQIINHGIANEVFENLKREQERVFRQPFRKKVEGGQLLNLRGGSYRWGNQRATCLRQLSWSEAIHVAVSDISGISHDRISR